MMNIPDPNAVFPNEYKTSCFIKNVVTAPNISVGDYTYYDDAVDPTGFERNNVLFNYPEFGDHLVIGKFCQIASGTKFIMGPANHRISSATTYPFNVFGGAWTENTPPHMAQLPRKGDTVIGNDVWIGRESIIMPGVKIGDGIEETLTYCDFPSEHWTRIRTNNVIERLNREIRRRTRVVGTFPDGNSALMLVCARLRHVAGTQWGSKKYMNMKHLEAALDDASIAG